MLHRISVGVRSSFNQDGAVALDQQRNSIFNFNRSGAELLRRLHSGAVSLEDLAKTLSDGHGVDPEMALQDASEFLQQLRTHGLIECTDDKGSAA